MIIFDSNYGVVLLNDKVKELLQKNPLLPRDPSNEINKY